MRDRIPTQVLENGALRYGVYDEAGNFLRHEYLALDDAPTDIGTELTKATLLRDSTVVSLFGAAADRTVDDAFQGLAGQLKLIMGDMASITVTLKDSAGTAIPGVLVQGILSDSGQAVYSNDSGVAAGYISEGSQVVKVTGYADIEDYSETLSVTKGTTISKTITLTTRNFLKITSSQSVKFSGNVETVDVTVVGGGGGGSSGSWSTHSDEDEYESGSGGGGGYCVNGNNISVSPNTLYPAVIGAGGIGGEGSSRNHFGGNPGGDGGTTSFLGVSASGGKGAPAGSSSGGIGNGNGGAGASDGAGEDGENGSVLGYSSFTETAKYGGGGGGGFAGHSGYGTFGGSGGADFGGKGGGYYEETPAVQAGTGGGGGGGGSYAYAKDAAAGGSGCIAVRMHLKSAA